MKFKISKNKISWALLVSVLIFSACSPSANEQQEPKKITKPLSYPLASVKLINPEYTLSIPGELKPYEQVAVFAKVTGFVKQLYVNRGDRVRKGQLLAVLEAPEMNQKYLSDKSTEQKIYSDYLYAKQAHDRLLDASKTTGAVAAIELDRAKSAMQSAQSAYQASKAGTAHSSQLQQYLRIVAPFDGVITHRNISVGALAGAGSNTPLFMMAQGSKLRLTLALPEKHAASVKNGVHAIFTVSSQPGKTFNAKLSRTSGLLDQQNRSLTLEFDVDNLSEELQGGDYAQVQLKLQRKNPSFWVATKSILKSETGSFIMKIKDNEIARIMVKEGIQLDTLTEVFGDILPNESILLKPLAEIKEGKFNN